MKLTIFQPIITSYRTPLFEGLSKSIDVTLVCDMPDESFGKITEKNFEIIVADWKSVGNLKYIGPSKVFEQLKASDHVIHFSDFKYSSLWLSLIACRFFKCKIWLHGQGGYKKNGKFQRFIYFLSILFSNGYICYTEYSANSLKLKIPKFLHSKVFVVENTLYLESLNSFEVKKPKSSIFYIGRLRQGCEIEFLLDAAVQASVEVEVIGSGEKDYVQSLEKKYSNSTFHGAVFDYQEQHQIASQCFAGAYGGDAGLSVVHYMAFGLPVIVHSDIDRHMGPEPSYIKDMINGLTFERGNQGDLTDKIVNLKSNKHLRSTLSAGASATFEKLSKLTMHEKFLDILGVVK